MLPPSTRLPASRHSATRPSQGTSPVPYGSSSTTTRRWAIACCSCSRRSSAPPPSPGWLTRDGRRTGHGVVGCSPRPSRHWTVSSAIGGWRNWSPSATSTPGSCSGGTRDPATRWRAAGSVATRVRDGTSSGRHTEAAQAVAGRCEGSAPITPHRSHRTHPRSAPCRSAGGTRRVAVRRRVIRTAGAALVIEQPPGEHLRGALSAALVPGHVRAEPGAEPGDLEVPRPIGRIEVRCLPDVRQFVQHGHPHGTPDVLAREIGAHVATPGPRPRAPRPIEAEQDIGRPVPTGTLDQSADALAAGGGARDRHRRQRGGGGRPLSANRPDAHRSRPVIGADAQRIATREHPIHTWPVIASWGAPAARAGRAAATAARRPRRRGRSGAPRGRPRRTLRRAR